MGAAGGDCPATRFLLLVRVLGAVYGAQAAPTGSSYLPRLSQANDESLKTLGAEAISAIPRDFPLTVRQTIIRDAIATGRPFVASDMALRVSRAAS